MIKRKVLSIFIDDFTKDEAVDKIIELCNTDTSSANFIITPNAEIAYRAERDPAFAEIINSANVVLPDGAGVVLVSKIVKQNIVSGKVPGIDAAFALLKKLEENKIPLFLLGASSEVVKSAAEKILKMHPLLPIAGTYHGFFKDDEEAVEQILKTNAKVVFVCLGAPKQEYFMYNNRQALKGRVLLGLGGTVDVLAGNVNLAPEFFRNNNLEWLYRLIKQPKRFMRMSVIPLYIIKAIIFRIKGE